MQHRIELREGSCIYVNGAHRLTDELAKYETEEVERHSPDPGKIHLRNSDGHIREVYRKERKIINMTIWIIHFADGTLASHYGSRDSAQAIAEGKKDLYGGDYIII